MRYSGSISAGDGPGASEDEPFPGLGGVAPIIGFEGRWRGDERAVLAVRAKAEVHFVKRPEFALVREELLQGAGDRRGFGSL